MPEDASDRRVLTIHPRLAALLHGRSMVRGRPEQPVAARTRLPVPAVAGRTCDRCPSAAVRVHGAACGLRVSLPVSPASNLLHLCACAARGLLLLRWRTALPRFPPTLPWCRVRRGEW